MKELTESPPISAFRARFEAGRSFDLDDDLEFCPGLLTEDDLQSINSSSSDGSLSSGSPHSSPLQQQIQPQQQVTPSFSLSSASNNNYNPSASFQSNNDQHNLKLHQPAALRTRNAIPIVNPTTELFLSGFKVASKKLTRQGTRLHIYKWVDPSNVRKAAGTDDLHSLPELKTEKKWTKKLHPGNSKDQILLRPHVIDEI
ncbi:MAG: hypothetical protein LQ337_000915 [Flavoplaca oasis]|nr:MAG: hypothetical protein LQ337_000915 [Flavoplaca oasis]